MNEIQLRDVPQGEYKVWGLGHKISTKDYFLELESPHDDLLTVMAPLEIKKELFDSSIVYIKKDGDIVLSPRKDTKLFAVFNHPESGERMPWSMRLHLKMIEDKWTVIEVDGRKP